MKIIKKIKNIIHLFMVLLIIIIIFILAGKAGAIPNLHKMLSKDSSDSTSALNLYSSNMILVRLKDGKTLMQKKSEEKIYPASLTKIMTAIVAIENLPNLQENIKLSDSIFKELQNSDASTAGFKPDENVRAIDLLYGALLPSGAECSIGLADKIAGSEQNFVGLMNKKAAKLSMKNTHFNNTTGLQDKTHYTTAKDMAILLDYALKNSTFRKIFTSPRYSSNPTNIHPKGITYYSTMFGSLKDPSIKDGKIEGGKTGYTEEAGLCLASLAVKDNQEYILVTVGAKGDHKSVQYNITDALTVYNSY